MAIETDGTDRDPLAWNQVFPDAHAVFQRAVPPLEGIRDECLVCLDTNALLAPFATSGENLSLVRAVLERIAKENRLVVPGQVAREFGRNRAQKLGDIFSTLSRLQSQVQLPSPTRIPILEDCSPYKKALGTLEQARKSLDQIRVAIGEVIQEVRAWGWDDPVSRMYRELFDSEVVVDPKIPNDEILEDHSRRIANRIAPGWRDAKKDDSGIGDVLIWHTILHVARERKTHMVFVSADEKSDWWHRSDSQALYPRFELLDEYARASDGCSFRILSLSTLLESFGVSPEAVDQIREGESDSTDLEAASERDVDRAVIERLAQAVVIKFIRDEPGFGEIQSFQTSDHMAGVGPDAVAQCEAGSVSIVISDIRARESVRRSTRAAITRVYGNQGQYEFSIGVLVLQDQDSVDAAVAMIRSRPRRRGIGWLLCLATESGLELIRQRSPFRR